MALSAAGANVARIKGAGDRQHLPCPGRGLEATDILQRHATRQPSVALRAGHGSRLHETPPSKQFPRRTLEMVSLGLMSGPAASRAAILLIPEPLQLYQEALVNC